MQAGKQPLSPMSFPVEIMRKFDLRPASQRGLVYLRPATPFLPEGRVRDTFGLPVTLGRIGPLEVRLATTKREIRAAQKVRFKVFYEEMGAIPDPATILTRRDKDAFDRLCDHLLVIDHEHVSKKFGHRRPKVVGTYRVLRQDVAEANFGFYSASEFDIEPLLERHGGMRFLELGRSCVLPPYRTKRTVELLWHGIWAYVRHHRIDVLFGCASLPGTDPGRLSQELSFLHHHARADAAWRVSPISGRHVAMDRCPAEAIDTKRAIGSLPPLMKAYLRVGARFGDGAVVDRQFGTTDVIVILRVADIDPRYMAFYDGDTGRRAA
jgi:L-ornithine Nalpha-acyltransferase